MGKYDSSVRARIRDHAADCFGQDTQRNRHRDVPEPQDGERLARAPAGKNETQEQRRVDPLCVEEPVGGLMPARRQWPTGKHGFAGLGDCHLLLTLPYAQAWQATIGELPWRRRSKFHRARRQRRSHRFPRQASAKLSSNSHCPRHRRACKDHAKDKRRIKIGTPVNSSPGLGVPRSEKIIYNLTHFLANHKHWRALIKDLDTDIRILHANSSLASLLPQND